MYIKKLSVILLVLATIGCSKKQEVIFEAQSISYKKKDSLYTYKIQEECSTISQELKTYLNDGWKVVTSSPKEKLVANNIGTCVGTEYILEK